MAQLQEQGLRKHHVKMSAIQDATAFARKVCFSGRVVRAALWVSNLALWLLDKRLIIKASFTYMLFVCLNTGELSRSTGSGSIGFHQKCSGKSCVSAVCCTGVIDR